MFRNFLKVTFRNFRKYKLYTFINIIGLSVALAFCILLFKYIQIESSYDSFHENGENIYRFVTSTRQGDEIDHSSLSPIQLGPTVTDEIPEITRFTRLSNSTTVVRANDKAFYETLLYADPGMLNIFSFQILKGDAENPLGERNSAVITESAAEKYFGDINPLGKILSIKYKGGFEDFIITGVTKNVPYNSTIKYDILLPYGVMLDKLPDIFIRSWGARTTRTYFQLDRGTLPGLTENKIRELLDKILRPIYGDRVDNVQLHLQPIEDIHLDTRYYNSNEPVGNPFHLYIMFAIGCFILILACINFINLTIGRAVTRFKEIGSRKILGSGRSGIILQFLLESTLLTLIAFLAALMLVELFTPLFNDLTGSEMTLSSMLNLQTLALFAALLAAANLLGGAYPAFYLSRFNVAAIIKGTTRTAGPNFITKSLVVIQFSMSVFFIICTFLMLNQLDFIKGADLGFKNDHILVIPQKAGDGEKMLGLLKNELRQLPSIKGICGSGQTLGDETTYAVSPAEYKGASSDCFVFRVDENFLSTMEIELLAGRNFSPEFPYDATGSVIVNETFVDRLNIDSPLGEEIICRIGALENNTGNIIGVVRDYNFLSLHTDIEPALLHVSPEHRIRYISIKIDYENIDATIAKIKEAWTRIAPYSPFEFYFLDEDFNRQYFYEERWSRILQYSSIFSLFIASLGLFGISSLAVNRRAKEISIRKVLGGTLRDILLLLNKDFLILVTISNVVAWPAAYFVINYWLENFAYRIQINPGIFPLAGFITLSVAMLTVSFRSLRTAVANPVEYLRYE
ncbi:MAG: ABC transporter permease [Candidatus Zixiibacteriota bacterium]|nr:MAG: ABC transporter permease [candidate division Zixibacteria bacterium]